jgi:hypothetical protein
VPDGEGRGCDRSFKPISDDFIRQWLEANAPDGLDGELLVKARFSDVAGHVGRKEFKPDFTFMVFDYVE